MWLSLVGAFASASGGRYSEQQAGAAVEIYSPNGEKKFRAPQTEAA